MAVRKIKSSKVRNELGRIMEEVFYKGDEYVIERGNKAMAAIIPIDEFRRIQEKREEFFAQIEQVWRQNKGEEPDTLEREVSAAVNDARKPDEGA